MLKALWLNLVYRPLFNLLLVLIVVFHGSLGFAIVVLTLIIRALLWNTTKKQGEMQQGMGDMQGKLKELEEKYKDKPDVLMQESMKLMKTGGMAPLKGCLGILVQLPIFIGLNYVIRSFAAGTVSSDSIYSFLMPIASKFTDIANVDHIFLGMDMFANHNIALTIIGCILIFLQTKLTSLFQAQQQKQPAAMLPGGQAMPDMQKMMGPMNLFMVFMMGSFIWSTQAGVGLYLVTTTLFSVIQYSIQNRELIKIKWITRNVNTDKATGKIVNKKG